MSKNQVNAYINDAYRDDSWDENSQTDLTGRAIIRSHSGYILFRYWIHILPILVTAILAYLNITNRFFMSSNDSNIIVKLNAFQFVAKLHEVLLGASLTLAIMDIIRSRLLTPEGVPLGFLLSPVRFTDLNWLLGSDFWHSLRSSSLPSSFRSIGTVTLLLVAILFTVIGGPLSAILIVPRPGFSHKEPALYYPVFYNKSAAAYSPSIIDSSYLRSQCFDLPADSTEGCPSEALKVVSVTLDPQEEDVLCSQSGTQISCNQSMFLTSPNHISRYVSVEFDQWSLTTVTSAPRKVIFEDLAYRMDLGMSVTVNMSIGQPIDPLSEQIVEISLLGNEMMYKPITRTTCEALDYTKISDLMKQQPLNISWDSADVIWLGDIDQTNDPSFLFTYMKNSSVLDNARPCSGKDCYQAIACSFDAQWVPMDVWYNTQQPSLLYHSFPQPRALLDSSGSHRSPRSINIKKDWLEAFYNGQTDFAEAIVDILNKLGTSMDAKPSNVSQSGNRLQSLQPLQPVNYTQAVSIMTSSVITEALAQIGTHSAGSLYDGDCKDVPDGYSYGPEICQNPPEHWAQVSDLGDLSNTFTMAQFSIRQYGYGWFLTSITVKIALGILLLHALFLTIYLIGIIALKRNITIRWSSSAELLVLAINSLHSRVLQGTSTGLAANRKLWSERVTIREVNTGLDPPTLTMVVGDPVHYDGYVGDLPRLGRKYI